MRKKVLVTGFFDMLHSGHVLFLEKAAKLGDLFVCIGNDKNLRYQKEKSPVCDEEERLVMVKALRCVKNAYISKQIGRTDFTEIIEMVKPDIFCINDDGKSTEKKMACEQYGVKYKVLLKRGENKRSTTALRKLLNDVATN